MASKQIYLIEFTWSKEKRRDSKRFPTRAAWEEAYEYYISLPDKFEDVVKRVK